MRGRISRGNPSNTNPPGVPKNDVQRVMSHYGVSEAEAIEMLSQSSVEELLPERGYRL